MEYIDKKKLQKEINSALSNVEQPSIECINRLIDQQSVAFDMNMVVEQLKDYGKYKGVLRLENDKCENFIPVSIAVKIVESAGLGGVLGYMENN